MSATVTPALPVHAAAPPPEADTATPGARLGDRAAEATPGAPHPVERATTTRWRLSKQFRFEAAHHLPAHDGKCRRPHGHSWVGLVEVAADTLIASGPKVDMVLDYGTLSDAVDPLVEQYLDHWDLNETTGLPNPTSEAIARWLFVRLDAVVPNLVAVTIRETCTSECRYERG